MHDVDREIAEAEERERTIIQELLISPRVRMAGVVDALGVCGHRVRGQKDWTLKLKLDAWRIAGQQIHTNPLSVRRHVSLDELKQRQELILPYSVVQFEARLSQHSCAGTAHALLEGELVIDSSDQELNRHAVTLQEPVTYAHEVFGTLTLDRRLNWYTGKTTWSGNTVELNVDAGESLNPENAIDIAHQLWKDQSNWTSRVKRYATAKLLPVKNRHWLEEDESELSAQEFFKRFNLTAVTVYRKGAFEFWHDDGGLFCGHAILVRGTVRDGPTKADIAG